MHAGDAKVTGQEFISLSKIFLSCTLCACTVLGSGNVTKNETQRAERRCPYNVVNDETNMSTYRRPGGTSCPVPGQASWSWCPSWAHHSSQVHTPCQGGLGLQLDCSKPFPKQPPFLLAADLQQFLPTNRGQSSERCPADPSCFTSNKALQNAMF